MRACKRIVQTLSFATMCMVLASGCATSRSAGINTAVKNIDSIKAIADNRDAYRLSKYEGVGLMTLGKAGAVGFGGMGVSGTVFARNPETKEFGPPAFFHYVGISAGIAYGGLNGVNFLLLFDSRDEAIRFARQSAFFSFSNEAAFLIWGRKQITIPSVGQYYSDGALLALGAIEAELYFGGPRNELHKNMYGSDVTVDQILEGDIAVPQELQRAVGKLNERMNQ